MFWSHDDHHRVAVSVADELLLSMLPLLHFALPLTAGCYRCCCVSLIHTQHECCLPLLLLRLAAVRPAAGCYRYRCCCLLLLLLFACFCCLLASAARYCFLLALIRVVMVLLLIQMRVSQANNTVAVAAAACTTACS